jgi:hypothetical protein
VGDGHHRPNRQQKAMVQDLKFCFCLLVAQKKAVSNRGVVAALQPESNKTSKAHDVRNF